MFTPDAMEDVAVAYAWYEERAPGLGESFLAWVEAKLGVVERSPLFFPLAVAGYRRAVMRRFPFELFYRWESGAVVIYSVFHCSQDPEKWQRRLGKPRGG